MCGRVDRRVEGWIDMCGGWINLYGGVDTCVEGWINLYGGVDRHVWRGG